MACSLLKYLENIISNNTFMPGLYIRKPTMILTFNLLKKHETGLVRLREITLTDVDKIYF